MPIGPNGDGKNFVLGRIVSYDYQIGEGMSVTKLSTYEQKRPHTVCSARGGIRRFVGCNSNSSIRDESKGSDQELSGKKHGAN